MEAKKQPQVDQAKDDNEFGDFVEVKDEAQQKADAEKAGQQQQFGVARARMPRGKELIGVIVQRLGGNRMEVHTTDGKSRNCRVPGRYRRRLWLRPKDVVIIVPWVDDDDKGDVIFKYRPHVAQQLRRKGVLDAVKDEF